MFHGIDGQLRVEAHRGEGKQPCRGQLMTSRGVEDPFDVRPRGEIADYQADAPDP